MLFIYICVYVSCKLCIYMYCDFQKSIYCVFVTNSQLIFFSSPGPDELLPSLGVRCPSSKLFTFQASSPTQLGQLEPNLAGMFLGWSSTTLLFFVPVGYSTWLPGPILCSDWLKFQRSSSLKLMN